MKNNFSFEVITVFEVFEHLYDPILEIKKLLNFTDNILFTTEIIPKSSPKPENWYYYSLDSGQHISFFTLKSLLLIAKKFNLNLISNGTNIHLLSKKKISRNLFNVISRDNLSKFLNIILRRNSLMLIDYELKTGKKFKKNSI